MSAGYGWQERTASSSSCGPDAHHARRTSIVVISTARSGSWMSGKNAQSDDRDSARKDDPMLKPDWVDGPHADGEYSAYALLDAVKYESYRLRVRQWEAGSWVGNVVYYVNPFEYFNAVKRRLPDVESAKVWCETALIHLMIVGTEIGIKDEQHDTV